MKKKILFVLFALFGLLLMSSYSVSEFVVQAYVPVEKTDSTYLITDGRVGKVEINMNVERLNEIFPAEMLEEKKAGGGDYKIYKVFGDNRKTPLMEMESLCADICVVSRILIYSPLYKTTSGIGVGNTFAELKKPYTMKNIIGGDNNTFMVYVKEFKDVCFLLKAAGVNAKQGKPYESSEIPDNAVINSVLIF